MPTGRVPEEGENDNYERRGGVASLRACLDESTGAAYMFGLQFLHDGNRIKLWKHTRAGRWETWHGRPLAWALGQRLRLRLEVAGGHLTGFVDGQLVAQQVDPDPLPTGEVALGAYCCAATFGGVWSVTMALPRAKLPTGKLYANFFRTTAGGGDYLAFSPDFGDRFNAPARLADVELE